MSDLPSDKVAGIQLAVFELIWPAFRWVEALYLRTESDLCDVHLRVSREPSQIEQDDFKRIIGEIFTAALNRTALRLSVTVDTRSAALPAYREIMSPEIFKMIAKELAPWRLEAGR
jgi:hypothetical protein